MTLFELSRFCHDIYSNEKVNRSYKRNKEKVLAEYKLNSKECQALKKLDVKTLFNMGLHPMLLWHLANMAGLGPKAYLEKLTQK